MEKTILILRYHWKAVLGWGLVALFLLGGIAQAQNNKPSMIACAVIAVEMSKTKCVRITAPTPERAVAVCADYVEVTWDRVYDYVLGEWEWSEVETPIDCGCERVNACLNAIETYGWGNLGVFEQFIPRKTPKR